MFLNKSVKDNPQPNNFIRGFLLNTRSLKSVNKDRNKLGLFQSLVGLKQAFVICLTETWLNSDVLDLEVLPTDQFNIYRNDRNSSGGGVLVAVRILLNQETGLNLFLHMLIHWN